MNKIEFMRKLQIELSKSVTRQEADKAMLYYGELIDDAMDSGAKEEEIIRRLPTPEAIVAGLADVIYADREPDMPKDDEIAPIIEKIFEEQGAEEKPKLSQRIKDFRDKHREGKTESAQKPQEPVKPEYKRTENYGKKTRTFSHYLGKLLILFFFLAIVLPVGVGILSAVWGVALGLFAACTALIVSGFAIPIYSIYLAAASSTVAVFFAFSAVGMFLVAIGAFGARCISYIFKAIVYVTKQIFKGMGAILGY